MKECRKCGEIKDIIDFPNEVERTCKKCRNKRDRERRAVKRTPSKGLFMRVNGIQMF